MNKISQKCIQFFKKINFQILVITIFVVNTNGYAESKKNLALIIGNATYKDGVLKEVRPDTRIIKKAISSLGIGLFEEKVHLNLSSKKEMDKLFKRYIKAINHSDFSFIYYAGHGVVHEGESYLIPVNVNMKDNVDIKYDAVNLSKVVERLESSKVGLSLLFLDTCRNSPYRGGIINRGLSRIKGVKSEMIISYATAAGDQVNDKNPYAEVLAELISKSPNIQIEGLLNELRGLVKKQTSNKQNPDFISFRSTSEPFCFAKCQSSSSTPSKTLQSRYEKAVNTINNNGDYKKAIRELTSLTNDGYPDAMCSLGMIYMAGKKARQNKQMGCELIRDAAKIGSNKAEKLYAKLQRIKTCK